MKEVQIILLTLILTIGCNLAKKENLGIEVDGIECNDSGCKGRYTGPEFVDGSDVGHQFSNQMSATVGHKLKELYFNEKYSRVDFSHIEMSTNGMGSGQVIYALSIPFVEVYQKCDAYTAFDHVGGWNHAPALTERKAQLSKALIPGGELDISDLIVTKEGLQEHWIQWKHMVIQEDCQ